MEPTTKSLPANAYVPLKEGETYTSFVPADKVIPEVTTRSVVIGVIMAGLFLFFACSPGPGGGQGFEGATPIAVPPGGTGRLLSPRSPHPRKLTFSLPRSAP
nr:hypothetical protein [FCB group bacterium]